jgi:hypothetical protein
VGLIGARGGSAWNARRRTWLLPWVEGKNPMRTLAPNSPAVQYEIDDELIDALIKSACPPLFDPLAGMDLAGLFKNVKPEPRRRPRAWTQRDIARALRAAKAAGVEARVVIEEGRVTLVPTKMVPAATDTDENPWERFRRG